jgi:hypothetical protein
VPDDREFSFTIDFARGEGDPRRVFDAASLLIQGFEELDIAVTRSIHAELAPTVVLEDIRRGSLKVILREILNEIDDDALRAGEYKKAIGPLLVKAKKMALEVLDEEKPNAPKAIEDLRNNLNQLVQESEVKHIPAYSPIRDGQFVSSLDKLQCAKRALGPDDKITVQIDDSIYEVDLTKTWEPSDVLPIPGTTERISEGTMILTIRRPDLLGGARWQFSHGGTAMYAGIEDERWLQRFHDGKIPLRSGDALRCRVRFTYVFNEDSRVIEQKTDIMKVLRLMRGPGHQTSFFDDD